MPSAYKITNAPFSRRKGGARARSVHSLGPPRGALNRDRKVAVQGYAVIAMYPGSAATRSIQARTAGKGARSKPPSWATWVYA